MRWATFLILLYLAAGLQAAQLFGFPHANNSLMSGPRIEYIVILMVFYSLFGADDQVPLAGLVAGLALDFISGEVLGTFTLAMGLVTLAIVKIRLSIFREHAASQILMTVLAVLGFAIISGFLSQVLPTDVKAGTTGQASSAGPGFFRYLWWMAGSALYTGLVAPVFFWILFRFRPVLGFSSHGPRSR